MLNIPVKHWYVNICKKRLGDHGITWGGTVSELRDSIQKEKFDLESPPEMKMKIYVL